MKPMNIVLEQLTHDSSPQLIAPSLSFSVSSNSQPRWVLLVDDEIDITSMLKLGLRKFGFEVDAFNDSNEATPMKPYHNSNLTITLLLS